MLVQVTADGLEPVPLPHLEGRGVESPVDAAWRAYVDHGRSCADCRVADFQCETAGDLWTAWTDARGMA